MSPSFAVIAEGPSDFEILRQILAGYFSPAASPPRPLRASSAAPRRGPARAGSGTGGWQRGVRPELGPFGRSHEVAARDDMYVVDPYASSRLPVAFRRERPAYAIVLAA